MIGAAKKKLPCGSQPRSLCGGSGCVMRALLEPGAGLPRAKELVPCPRCTATKPTVVPGGAR